MRFHRVLAALSVLLLASVSAFAQLTTGNLTGTVTTAGAPLPGVTVSLAAPTLQGTRTAITDSNGAYNFQGLPPGDYAWWVYSLETGKQVAKLPYSGALTEATVLGGRLYHLSGGQGRPDVGTGSVG